jgi:hypothetical protein
MVLARGEIRGIGAGEKLGKIHVRYLSCLITVETEINAGLASIIKFTFSRDYTPLIIRLRPPRRHLYAATTGLGMVKTRHENRITTPNACAEWCLVCRLKIFRERGMVVSLLLSDDYEPHIASASSRIATDAS